MRLRASSLVFLGAAILVAQRPTVTSNGAHTSTQLTPIQTQQRLSGRTDPAAIEEWQRVMTEMHLAKDPGLKNVVARLRALRLYDNETWINLVNTGYAYLSDTEGAQSFRVELARQRPDSSWAVQAAIQQWQSTHPPRTTTDAGFHQFTLEQLAFLKRLHQEKPHSSAATQEYVRAALPAASLLQPAEALEVADLALQSNRLAYGSDLFLIVDIYLRHPSRLDRVPGLLKQELQQLQTVVRSRLDTGPASELANILLLDGQFRVHVALAEYWLQKKNQDQAKTAAMQARTDLTRLSLFAAVDPRGRVALEDQQRQLSKLASRLNLQLPLSGPPVQIDWNQVSRRPLEPFEAPDLNSRRWSLQQWKGKLVLVNMWATWCAPCRAELPYIQKLYDSTQGQPGRLIISINVDSNPELARRLIQEHHYTFPVINSQHLADLIDFSNGVPQNRIVDRQGRLLVEPIEGSGAELIPNVLRAMSQLQ